MYRDLMALNADIETAEITQAQKTANYYTPVFRIRIHHEALHSNRSRGMVQFEVISFNNAEVFQKSYHLLISKVADTESNLLLLIDRNYREQLISCFVRFEGEYATIYVKSTASTYNTPIFIRFTLAPYRTFIEPLYFAECDVDKATLTGTIVEPTVINKPSLAFVNSWTNNIDTTYTTKISEYVVSFDRVSVRCAVKSGTYTDGAKIATLAPLPHMKPIKLIGHTVASDGTIGHCTITVEANGDILIYGATTNNLVFFEFDYSVYY